MLPFPRSWRGDGRMSRRSRRRRRVEPTDDWEQLLLLTRWPEQVRYELIRPVVLFGESAAERARETEAASERTLRRKIGRFEAEGMESLFDAEPAKRRELPPAIRRLVVDLKAEYPHLNTNEIAGICYVRFGRRPDVRTVRRVLEEEPVPLRMIRRYPPYHEIPEAKERRMAVVSLHAEGWTVKAIAGYLKINRDTVYHTLRRWLEEGADGLEDRPRGRPKGVRKVDLGAIDAVRRLQQNPELGAFRVHAALKQLGIGLSPATCGRILALNRRLYGLEKPNAGAGVAGRGRCPSPRRVDTATGPPTCATSTPWMSTFSAAGPTRSPCWRTIAAQSWRARSRPPRTCPPSSRCSTGPWRG